MEYRVVLIMKLTTQTITDANGQERGMQGLFQVRSAVHRVRGPLGVTSFTVLWFLIHFQTRKARPHTFIRSSEKLKMANENFATFSADPEKSPAAIYTEFVKL